MDATCKTCPMWTAHRTLDALDNDTGPSGIGTCHHVSAIGDPEGMTRQEAWWCSEHPLRQRDRLAAMALHSMAEDLYPAAVDAACAKDIAQAAYRLADAMLAARAASPGSEDHTKGGE